MKEHSDSPGFGLWIYHVPFLCREAYFLEETNYYGRPIPLLHTDHDVMWKWVIFKGGGGGLYSIRNSEPKDTTIVLLPGLSLEDIVSRIEDYGQAALFLEKKESLYCLFALNFWESEVQHVGCNRWAELKARDGEVHPNWLRTERRSGSWFDCP